MSIYALRDKNDKTFDVTGEEMMKFLGIILVSGYHHLITEDSYWSIGQYLEAPIFKKTMSREKFR